MHFLFARRERNPTFLSHFLVQSQVVLSLLAHVHHATHARAGHSCRSSRSRSRPLPGAWCNELGAIRLGSSQLVRKLPPQPLHVSPGPQNPFGTELISYSIMATMSNIRKKTAEYPESNPSLHLNDATVADLSLEKAEG